MTRKRLQRPGTDKSPLINKFNQVLTRHFLTMFITAGIFIFFSFESFVNSIYHSTLDILANFLFDRIICNIIIFLCILSKQRV